MARITVNFESLGKSKRKWSAVFEAADRGDAIAMAVQVAWAHHAKILPVRITTPDRRGAGKLLVKN